MFFLYSANLQLGRSTDLLFFEDTKPAYNNLANSTLRSETSFLLGAYRWGVTNTLKSHHIQQPFHESSSQKTEKIAR